MSAKANSETGYFRRMRSTRPKTALKNELVKLGIPSQASNTINTLWKEWGKQDTPEGWNVYARCGPEHCVFAETICGPPQQGRSLAANLGVPWRGRMNAATVVASVRSREPGDVTT